MWLTGLAGLALSALALRAAFSGRASRSLDDCPGYNAFDVVHTDTGLTARLALAGACGVYGEDVQTLRLYVNYDSEQRLHVKIEDKDSIAYQVPTSVFPTPHASHPVSPQEARLDFAMVEAPFSFKVVRKSNKEVLFDTAGSPIVFGKKYLRLRTALPKDPNLYGLGEHTDPFHLSTTNYTRTMWSRDAYGLPAGTNLYGSHPVYFDHRPGRGTHGVFILSSSGMDVKINKTEKDGQYLEYNLLGGIFDLYFLEGPSPTQVAHQYSDVVGKSAMMPYWSFGLHQCRYGYRDFYAIAEVIHNYRAAGIPLETMWTDIDYMYERYIFTTDPDRFPIERVREYVDYLHEHDQRYIVMVDPAISYQTERENGLPYDAFVRARDQGILLYKEGSIYKGVVWPGVSAFPDWFHPDSQSYWTNEFAEFFDAETGIDIDGLWIDMNEAANFNFFGDDPEDSAKKQNLPPARPALRSAPWPIPGFPQSFQPNQQSPYPPNPINFAHPWLAKAPEPSARAPVISSSRPKPEPSGSELIGFPKRNLLNTPYQIKNAMTIKPHGGLSNFTLDTDIIHYDGHVELDVHNLYGLMMSIYSRNAMEARRPGRRPFIITRSTFAGAGRTLGKWLGDNLSTWEQYRQSIQGMLDFAAIYQVPMVGSDVCGFGSDTTERLCARWATLGAFYPFYRNHNADNSKPQEFYLWDTVAEAARKAIDIRYRLIDYIYTALHKQSVDGTPLLNPMFFMYPEDVNTVTLDLQFFYGDSIMVAPVTEKDSTSVDVYFPDDRFYDLKTHNIIEGTGAKMTLTDIGFTDIPLYIRGGSIIPMRNASGYTTTDVRKQPFNIVIAPGRDGAAKGSLYLDDGDSIEQPLKSKVDFDYDNGVLTVSGTFDYQAENNRIATITVLGQQAKQEKHAAAEKGAGVKDMNQEPVGWHESEDQDPQHEGSNRAIVIELDQKLDKEFTVSV